MSYTAELRKEVADKRRSGVKGTDLSVEYGIPLTTIYRWTTEGASERHRKRNAEKYRSDPNHAKIVMSRVKDQRNLKYKNDLDFRLREILRSLESKAKKRNHLGCNASIQELKDSWTGKCHSCGVPECDLDRRLCVDHCHTTGTFRGYLCDPCNKALGLCNEQPMRLVNYLMQTQRDLQNG